MLWTLHNRASEASRTDGIIRDEKCIEIYRALDYDYERSFGPADAAHGVRSNVFDALIRRFLVEYPAGVIINLGEGLETQRFRVMQEGSLWLSVDVPEAIAIRERFIQPDDQHQHIACSALDQAWFDAVPEERPVFVAAQGLFMYFEPSDVQTLVTAMARRWPGMQLAFDHIPPWFSKKTLSEKGMQRTPHYTTPRMPWGIRVNEVIPTLRRWAGAVEDLGPVPFRFPRGAVRWFAGAAGHVPVLRNHLPGVTHVRLQGAAARP
ncbi:MAG: class I SAM-dependent methyltransferase [Myxococcota bacterium]